MMNFMGSDSQQGYYDEEGRNGKGKLPFSSSSSSTWNTGCHFPFCWLVNNPDESRTTPQLKLMMDYSSRNHSMTTGSGGDDDNTAPAAAADADNDDQTEDRVHMLSAGINSFDGLGRVGIEGGSASSVGGSNSVVIEREHMFDKVVTPSDVGKLNRLVIPKQHAERYFPLDSSTNEKGLLLNFEDRNGKGWRFRYSYWKSSQSYVFTKGWSRFVKEKKLDASDIVSFQCGMGELYKDRLFVDWRCRPDVLELAPPLPIIPLPHHFPYHSSIQTWNPSSLQPQGMVTSFPGPPRDQALMMHPNSTVLQSNPNNYRTTTSPFSYNSVLNPCSGSVIYFRSAARGGAAPQQQVGMVQVQRRGRGGSGVEPIVFDSVPVVQGKAAAKRLRLFGVNMDCTIPESDECEVLSSKKPLQQPPQLSSSTSSVPSIQLRPYNGTPLQAFPSDFLNKGN